MINGIICADSVTREAEAGRDISEVRKKLPLEWISRKPCQNPVSGPSHLGGFGETLPYHENKITLDKTRKDKWGLNVLAMDVEYKENEKKMRVDMKNDAMEMLDSCRCIKM